MRGSKCNFCHCERKRSNLALKTEPSPIFFHVSPRKEEANGPKETRQKDKTGPRRTRSNPNSTCRKDQCQTKKHLLL